MAQERLQKIIARAGVASRRKAEEMILHGQVTVNRKTVTKLGTKADPDVDTIRVDGRALATGGPKKYILLNKPKGHISSVSDPRKRPVVTELVDKRTRVGLFPVGRLDYDTEGVLILTNDGELTNRLIHPRYNVEKKYLVKVRHVPDEKDLRRLERGVRLEDGRTKAAKVKFIRKTRENSWVEITVTEGRNRLIKRMCAAVGHPVSKIKRIEFAGIKVRGLAPAEYRTLTAKEVRRLKKVGGYER